MDLLFRLIQQPSPSKFDDDVQEDSLEEVEENALFLNKFHSKVWFKRRILHAPSQILILVDSN